YGYGNDALIVQGGGSDGEDGRMYSAIYQFGIGNAAENRQGESDASVIYQDGIAQEAYVDQEALTGVTNRTSLVDQGFMGGDNNDAFVTQRADDNDSTVIQGGFYGGSRNYAEVNQDIGSDR